MSRQQLLVTFIAIVLAQAFAIESKPTPSCSSGSCPDADTDSLLQTVTRSSVKEDGEAESADKMEFKEAAFPTDFSRVREQARQLQNQQKNTLDSTLNKKSGSSTRSSNPCDRYRCPRGKVSGSDYMAKKCCKARCTVPNLQAVEWKYSCKAGKQLNEKIYGHWNNGVTCRYNLKKGYRCKDRRPIFARCVGSTFETNLDTCTVCTDEDKEQMRRCVDSQKACGRTLCTSFPHDTPTCGEIRTEGACPDRASYMDSCNKAVDICALKINQQRKRNGQMEITDGCIQECYGCVSHFKDQCFNTRLAEVNASTASATLEEAEAKSVDESLTTKKTC